MAKLILTPFLAALLMLGLALTLLGRRAASLDRRGRLAVRLGWVAVMWLVLTGLPVFGHVLEVQLSAQYCGESSDSIPMTDAAVVLSGSAVRSVGAPAVLSEEGVERVQKGVAIFLAGLTGRLVMAGQSDARMGERDVDLMRDFAIASGVPVEQIDLEPNAVNTRQHPVALLEVSGIRPTTKLAVVTSGYHLPRAMGQFKKYFHGVIGVAATCPRPRRGSVNEWVPSGSGLDFTGHMGHEYIGRVWYTILDLLGR